MVGKDVADVAARADVELDHVGACGAAQTTPRARAWNRPAGPSRQPSPRALGWHFAQVVIENPDTSL